MAVCTWLEFLGISGLAGAAFLESLVPSVVPSVQFGPDNLSYNGTIIEVHSETPSRGVQGKAAFTATSVQIGNQFRSTDNGDFPWSTGKSVVPSVQVGPDVQFGPDNKSLSYRGTIIEVHNETPSKGVQGTAVFTATSVQIGDQFSSTDNGNRPFVFTEQSENITEVAQPSTDGKMVVKWHFQDEKSVLWKAVGRLLSSAPVVSEKDGTIHFDGSMLILSGGSPRRLTKARAEINWAGLNVPALSMNNAWYIDRKVGPECQIQYDNVKITSGCVNWFMGHLCEQKIKGWYETLIGLPTAFTANTTWVFFDPIAVLQKALPGKLWFNSKNCPEKKL